MMFSRISIIVKELKVVLTSYLESTLFFQLKITLEEVLLLSINRK